MQRQHFEKKADRAEYNDLFRMMSPVQTPYWCRPGSPPSLIFRADFDEYAHTFDMRSSRIIIKGRFQGGNVGYIFADELPLFASVYSKDRRKLPYNEIEILELLHREGPMSIDEMKRITGLFSKNISPVLHRLQQKFLVFEDQADDEWDRAWYLFETEFPDIDLDEYEKKEAMKILVMRFAYLNVFIKPAMLRSFYRLQSVDIDNTLSELESEDYLVKVNIDNEYGYLRKEDIPLLEKETRPEKGVFVLHLNDFLVKSNENMLLDRFDTGKYHIPPKSRIMHFILVDGEFRGFLAGFFRIRPDVIEDVILDLDEQEKQDRKQEILDAVELVYDPESTPVKRYCGKKP
jgi:hypothetical protein